MDDDRTSTAPLTVLAVAAAAGACLLGALCVAQALLAGIVVERDSATPRAPGEASSDRLVLLHDQIGLPLLLVTLVVWPLTAAWLSAARRHLVRTAPEFRHTRSDVWAGLGWVVPIVMLWFPYQVVRDVHRAAHRTWRSPLLVIAWWASWLALLSVNRAGGSQPGMLPTGQLDAVTSRTHGIVVAVVTVVALTLWVATIGQVSRALARHAAPARSAVGV